MFLQNPLDFLHTEYVPSVSDESVTQSRPGPAVRLLPELRGKAFRRSHPARCGAGTALPGEGGRLPRYQIYKLVNTLESYRLPLRSMS